MRSRLLLTLLLNAVLLPATARAEALPDSLGDSSGTIDIVSIDGTSNATTLFLTAHFAPGTLHAAKLGFSFGLDTDLDSNTGLDCSGTDLFPCGSEWRVTFNSLIDSENARLISTEGTVFGTIPVSFSTDTLQISLPLNPDPSLGLPDDGIVLFGLSAGSPISTAEFDAEDFASDDALNGPLAVPTTFVPEPSTALLLMTAMLGLAGWRRSGTDRCASRPQG